MDNFKSPFNPKNEQEKLDIGFDDVIPQGDGLDKLISNQIKSEPNKNKSPNNLAPVIPSTDKVFMSNNQIYKKKEEIDYGKKSHLEFIKTMSMNKDPLMVQANGGLRKITMEEVELHNSKGSMWTVLNGNVYDLSLYVDYHPGGEKKLMMGAGQDCTFLFSK